MSESLSIPDVTYDGTGQCIICLKHFTQFSSGRDAPSLEHVIPEYMCGTGKMVIKGGTCVGYNNAANERFEHAAAKADLKIARTLLGLRRKKRGRAEQGKLKLPSIAAGHHLTGGGEFDVNLTLEEFPKPVTFLVPQPAGKLVGIDRGRDLVSPRPFILSLGANHGHPLGQFTMEWSSNHTAFALTVAKIAYCYAAADAGLETFDGNEMRALLKGERDDVYNFVGGNFEPGHLTDRFLHNLYHRKRGEMATVVVHLFASFKMIPYEVVVGNRLWPCNIVVQITTKRDFLCSMLLRTAVGQDLGTLIEHMETGRGSFCQLTS